MSRPAFGTAPIKCAKQKCGWTGTENDLVRVAKDAKWGALVCPRCGHDSYSFTRRKTIAEHSLVTETVEGAKP